MTRQSYASIFKHANRQSWSIVVRRPHFGGQSAWLKPYIPIANSQGRAKGTIIVVERTRGGSLNSRGKKLVSSLCHNPATLAGTSHSKRASTDTTKSLGFRVDFLSACNLHSPLLIGLRFRFVI